MDTKFNGLSFSESEVKNNIRRLINKVWKLIPMRENNEDWKKQITYVVVEFAGLQELFKDRIHLMEVISKLEGLKTAETDFMEYRSLVFSILSLLGSINEHTI
jgi:hypothetical protein